MRIFGLVLITAGFLAGALASIYDPALVHWVHYLIALVLGIIGVVLVQVAVRREATDASRLESNTQILHSSLEKIVDALGELDRRKSSLDPYELPAHIDATFRDDIAAFADARESIIHIWGMRAYGDVMSHFAAGERYLNRVWSAAADGYITEAQTFIERSRQQFDEAHGKLRALGAGRDAAA